MTTIPTIKSNPNCEYKVDPAEDSGIKGWRLSARPNGTERWAPIFGLFTTRKEAVEFAEKQGWKPTTGGNPC